MSDVLNFDMCQKLRKAFSEFSREAEQQAERTSKAAEQDRYTRSYAKRHEPNNTPPSAA